MMPIPISEREARGFHEAIAEALRDLRFQGASPLAAEPHIRRQIGAESYIRRQIGYQFRPALEWPDHEWAWVALCWEILEPNPNGGALRTRTTVIGPYREGDDVLRRVNRHPGPAAIVGPVEVRELWKRLVVPS